MGILLAKIIGRIRDWGPEANTRVALESGHSAPMSTTSAVGALACPALRLLSLLNERPRNPSNGIPVGRGVAC
ncbi:hypothetical protein SAMN05444680_12731 [Variovorax sp. YR216]|nr:hypothetical protein SAMN05444680_12731 [Variovorax sp. YR216]